MSFLGCSRPVMTLRKQIEDIKTLQKAIKDENLECHDVIPDGNCLFAAIADQLFTQGIFDFSFEVLREAAVNYLREILNSAN